MSSPRPVSPPHSSFDALRASVEEQWATMPEACMVKVCNAFRPRQEAMIKAEGGRFDK